MQINRGHHGGSMIKWDTRWVWQQPEYHGRDKVQTDCNYTVRPGHNELSNMDERVHYLPQVGTASPPRRILPTWQSVDAGSSSPHLGVLCELFRMFNWIITLILNFFAAVRIQISTFHHEIIPFGRVFDIFAHTKAMFIACMLTRDKTGSDALPG